jgi:hypothetical protein
MDRPRKLPASVATEFDVPLAVASRVSSSRPRDATVFLGPLAIRPGRALAARNANKKWSIDGGRERMPCESFPFEDS